MRNLFGGLVFGAAVLAGLSLPAAAQGYVNIRPSFGADGGCEGGLGAAAERIRAAVDAGDNAGAEASLSAVFSGVGVKGEAVPVYLTARPEAQARAAAPVPVLVPAAPAAGGAHNKPPPAADDDESAAPDDAKPADSNPAASGKADGGDKKKPPLWQGFLAGCLGILVVMIFICL